MSEQMNYKRSLIHVFRNQALVFINAHWYHSICVRVDLSWFLEIDEKTPLKKITRSELQMQEQIVRNTHQQLEKSKSKKLQRIK